ncbi:FAD-dependent monooxygenase [Deinococcus altitudinis]|uniref:FAD-dependent monooxygenase n=1 Tax=Deinococcus altitudinis TaxID=468914 RepID=UPI003891DA8B
MTLRLVSRNSTKYPVSCFRRSAPDSGGLCSAEVRAGSVASILEKLAAVLRGHGTEALLDTFKAEWRPFAEALVETTDRGRPGDSPSS